MKATLVDGCWDLISIGINFVTMITFSTIKSIKTQLNTELDSGKTIGFVPTMGALHAGHIALMKQAKKENDVLVVSIFVNPIQFNNKEDLKKYPRDLSKDQAMLDEIGCDILFAPGEKEMYPGPVTKSYEFGKLGTVMEGASRPGHFNGVGIVVKKLFDIVSPTKAYFGEKDFQQLAIIKKLVKIENLPVEIIPAATVRENDGLAMSSRNERLTTPEREIAPFIQQSLVKAKNAAPAMPPAEVKAMVRKFYDDQPKMELEYFEIADDTELHPIDNWNDAKGVIGFIVVHIGKVRLIDNIRIY